MITLSRRAFLSLVEQRKQPSRRPAGPRERVLRPDQEMSSRQTQQRRLATCPSCDFVVDAQHLHPDTGLCPRCHGEQTWR